MHLEYFQMIDRIDTIDPDKSVLTATATVPKDSPVFEGHFPGLPLVPGVLLIETMAQASGFLIMARSGFAQMPFLVGVKEGKLRTFVEPETELQIEAKIEHDGSGFAMTNAELKSGGKRISNSQLTFKTMEFPDAKFAKMISDRAGEIGMPKILLPNF